MGQAFSDEDDGENANLLFYQNKIRSRPWPGKKIEKMLKWKGDYSKLEQNHSYIQWLFPISEGRGANASAQQLYKHEAEAIMVDKETAGRVIRAYDMMLDFYGTRLVNINDGTLRRALKWEERLTHLNRSKHNFRRITRIIKSLGELGYEHYQAQLVMFLIEEGIVHKTIPNAVHGAMRFWIESIHDDQERDEVRRRFEELRNDGPSRCTKISHLYQNSLDADNDSNEMEENSIDR